MNLADITFGIELEVSDSNGDFSGFAQDDDPHDSFEGFTVKCDGSVEGDELEFVSPILRGASGLEAVENFCNRAELGGWYCDDSCGYHLHIGLDGFTDLERRKIVQGYVLTEDFWYRLCPGRRDTSWCRPIPVTVTGETIEATFSYRRVIDAMCNGRGRYCWCNTAALYNHQTLEIRMHAGTIKPVEVLSWIKAHLTFVATMPTLKKHQIRRRFTGKTVSEQFEVISKIWGDAGITDYYRKRGDFQVAERVDQLKALHR